MNLPELNDKSKEFVSSHDVRGADWYVESACRYYKRMGRAGIIYITFVFPFGLYGALTDKSPKMGELIGMPTMAAIVLLYFACMIRTAALLPNDFTRLYARARWLGILAGSFGFPILTIPAFVAVSRLAKYRTITAGDTTATAL